MLTVCLSIQLRFKLCNTSFPCLVAPSVYVLNIKVIMHSCFIFFCFLLFFSAKKLNTFTLCAIERKCEMWNVSLSYFLT